MVTRNPTEPEVNVAQSFVLSCIAGGGTGFYTYQWTSTCSGGCVVNTGNQASAMLVRNLPDQQILAHIPAQSVTMLEIMAQIHLVSK